MAKGSKYWASSYIILKSGKKIYLENRVEEIEKKMKSDEARIRFKLSTILSSKTIYINKDAIDYYGSV